MHEIIAEYSGYIRTEHMKRVKVVKAASLRSDHKKASDCRKARNAIFAYPLARGRISPAAQTYAHRARLIGIALSEKQP